MIQPSKIIWTTMLTAVLLLLPSGARADKEHGKLRVTSFPTGAHVSVDGADTGKVTPMSYSLPEGKHTVMVSMPNSGWSSDTRTVDVGEGNNDLSVTLAPIAVVGAIGPPGPAGPAGPQGPVGPAGPQGPAGPAGPAGPTGATGAVGPTGLTGAQGPAGPQGPKGDTGATGPAGATGATGAMGATGLTGPAGPAGPQGPKGDTGATGAVGPMGLTGLTGPQGSAGPQGPKGDTGATGAAGPTGAPGAPGNTGATGPAGPSGPTGAQGPAGPTGGLSGRQEFQSGGTFVFVVPTGVTRLSVELYGAGGGGTVVHCNSGGGGGAGAYTSTILTVQEGQTLAVNVGRGGLAQTSTATGGKGDDTQILDANNLELAVAHGGSGGQPSPNVCGQAPTGAAGGASDPNAMISHSGASAPAVSPFGTGGMGYLVTGFAFQPNGQFGGGGAGALFNPPTQAGQGGYALLSW